MNIFRSMDISGSALTAQRYRMDIIGENIANAETTRTEDGSVYTRKNVVFQARKMSFSDTLHSAIASRTDGIGGLREHHYYTPKDSFTTDTGLSVGRRITINWNAENGSAIKDILYRGVFSGGDSAGGVNVIAQTDSKQPYKIVLDPEHPDADENGYVTYPNVDIEQEMVDFMSATRSYEANITAINNFRNIAMKALEIGK